MTKLIIDTDIGTDADDAMALTYAVRSGMDIALISTVHGNTRIRAAIAEKLCGLLGANIPIAAGEGIPAKQKFLYWTGLEGKDFLAPGEQFVGRTDGVEAIIETARAHAGDVEIVAIGPLTNIAAAFERAPDLVGKVNRMYLMGNAMLCGNTYHLNYRAHNFKADPEAADAVLALPIPKLLITTEVSKQLPVTPAELDGWMQSGDPVCGYLAQSARTWMQYIKYDTAFLYDPLVLEHARDPSVTTRATYGSLQITTAVDLTFKGRFLKTVGGKP